MSVSNLKLLFDTLVIPWGRPLSLWSMSGGNAAPAFACYLSDGVYFEYFYGILTLVWYTNTGMVY